MRYLNICVLLLSNSVATAAEPATTASKWLDGLGSKGLVVAETVNEKEAGFTAKQVPSAVGAVTKFSYQKTGWWVTVAFKGKHNASTPLKTLQSNFWYATIDKMPTPGLDIAGWDINPRTPSSQIKKGVKLVEYGSGKMKVVIATKAFALSGRDTTVLVPADASAPKGSYFQIRKEIPINLTIAAPVKF